MELPRKGCTKNLQVLPNTAIVAMIKKANNNSFFFSLVLRASIPFQQAHHLVNPWNDHKKVQISRGGQVRLTSWPLCVRHCLFVCLFVFYVYV